MIEFFLFNGMAIRLVKLSNDYIILGAQNMVLC